MPDDVRLAARLWLPEGADGAAVPAIFEYIPYRKADMVRARDERNHPYFASHGYACLRVDMRGSGDSEGHMPDMYSEHELTDARHVIEWIAVQPWCNGNVGMFGTSWGGTASLQANIDAPSALKAIIAVCATHDRYEDDIHHKGGCLLTDTVEWGATLPAILGAPPTPHVGEDWRERWQDRLDNLSFSVEHWVREEARGRYWRHGSVIHQADHLSRPILAVGGWSDRYSNSVMSLVSARPDLVWGLVGPWGHHYPDHGQPGPAMGFQQVALEWWDHWLKPGQAVPDWPRLRVWLREYDPPANAIDYRSGGWIESGPPDTVTQPLMLYLTDGLLARTEGPNSLALPIPADLRIGRASGDTGYFGRHGGLPLDQNEDDTLSLTFETAPLETDLVLYGAMSTQLLVETVSKQGQVSLRVNDVAPDGTSARVGLCVRNLALNDQLDAPEACEQETERVLNIPFHTKAYTFRRGHRIRLSIAACYWPMIWPAASDNDVILISGKLIMPVYQGQPQPLAKELPPALGLPAVKTHYAVSDPPLRRSQQTTKDGRLINSWEQPFAETFCSETQTAFGYETRAEHSITPGDPLSAKSSYFHRARYTRPDGVAEITSALSVNCDRDSFVLTGTFTADWQDEKIGEKTWTATISRQFG
ncbi:CocE/NonD family hydrolase [Ruegeria sp. 2205SS24-7]|uniref:CocE/NonD family hydrolase n=1 Tax=Ruegeria discodermiae TaxID=3064389 RepID=UPI002740837B|nr:CocE/NonD family hydrolase [Ruegeria sp. 2205SS24-7]MDP5215684.1 CocE/NonD family hydrolase [Ruegeria sp. 2205SS24-7]